MKAIILVGLFAFASCSNYENESVQRKHQLNAINEYDEIQGRQKRSFFPGAPGITSTTTPRTVINPGINRDEHGTVNAGTTFEHHGKDYDVEGHWNKNVRGPGRAKPVWGVRGSIRFRRSLQPEAPGQTTNFSEETVERQKRSFFPGAPGVTSTTTPRTVINPGINRDEHGTVNAGTTFEHHGKDYDVEGHWNKNVRGPGRAKPVWGVRGSIRFRRSLQPGAPGQSKNVDKETVERQKRSFLPGAPGVTSTTTPRTVINPGINRDEHGTVNAGTTFEHHGKDYDVEGHWNKNVRGPGRAKPVWGVRGSIRFRRSLQPGAPGQSTTTPRTVISPGINRGEDGTVNAGTTFEHHGKDYDVNGHWNKNIRGPGRAKPVWGVRGSIRFRRAVQAGGPNLTSTTTPKNAINPEINRGEDGTVNAGSTYEHHGKNYDVKAHWNKNVRGPGRAKPTWGVNASFRFKRSQDEQ